MGDGVTELHIQQLFSTLDRLDVYTRGTFNLVVHPDISPNLPKNNAYTFLVEELKFALDVPRAEKRPRHDEHRGVHMSDCSTRRDISTIEKRKENLQERCPQYGDSDFSGEFTTS